MNICLGFLLIVLVCFGCVWKQVMLKKFMVMVLLRQRIIQVMEMWCVVGIDFIELVVMKCVRMCGWLKQFRFQVISEIMLMKEVFLSMLKLVVFFSLMVVKVGLMLLVVSIMIIGVRISVKIISEVCMVLVQFIVRKLLMKVQVMVVVVLVYSVVLQERLKVFLNRCVLVMMLEVQQMVKNIRIIRVEKICSRWLLFLKWLVKQLGRVSVLLLCLVCICRWLVMNSQLRQVLMIRLMVIQFLDRFDRYIVLGRFISSQLFMLEVLVDSVVMKLLRLWLLRMQLEKLLVE